MNNIALLVVDMQNSLVEGYPYNIEVVVEHIKKIISAARENDKEVIFVRHDDGKNSDLERFTEGWNIYDEIAPKENEYIIEKTFNSAFHKTDLQKYLNSKNIDTLIITGMQTEYCIDATIKSAFDYEYKIILPESTNTTYDNDYLSGENLVEFYNYEIWNDRFAKILPVDEVIKCFLKAKKL